MSELREECYKCLNNQSCPGSADYGSIICMTKRKFKMPSNEEDSVYAIKFAVMQQQINEKDKKIKELEEENQKYIVQLTDEQYRNLVEIIRKEVKKEFEQKVKDRIEELKLSGGSNGKDNVENLARELATEVLEELLEEK